MNVNAIRERLVAFPVSTFPHPLASSSPLPTPHQGRPASCASLAVDVLCSPRATATHRSHIPGPIWRTAFPRRTLRPPPSPPRTMPLLHDPPTRAAIEQRIGALRPDARR